MIDTDKYEGHTPAEEWGDIVYADGYRSIFLDDDVYATDLDTQLMTDAPLLLAEVKRLQKESHQRWLQIRELNELLNDFREAYE
tara:strand:+ start:8501 stop:8752 length:252 start_codon:yes stop_codon:yes gene_type:complete